MGRGCGWRRPGTRRRRSVPRLRVGVGVGVGVGVRGQGRRFAFGWGGVGFGGKGRVVLGGGSRSRAPGSTARCERLGPSASAFGRVRQGRAQLLVDDRGRAAADGTPALHAAGLEAGGSVASAERPAPLIGGGSPCGSARVCRSAVAGRKRRARARGAGAGSARRNRGGATRTPPPPPPPPRRVSGGLRLRRGLGLRHSGEPTRLHHEQDQRGLGLRLALPAAPRFLDAFRQNGRPRAPPRSGGCPSSGQRHGVPPSTQQKPTPQEGARGTRYPSQGGSRGERSAHLYK